MKTYEDRMISIQKKAKRKKFVRTCIKTAASTLCLVAIIVGLMHIPYGSSNVGVNPTNPTNRPTVTNPPTMTTVPTVPTVPTTKPTEPIINQYEDFTFADLYMGWAKVKYIEELWAEKDFFGDSEYMKFCDPEEGIDGIRYYGSFTWKFNSGKSVTYDILFVPCKNLPVASEFTLEGHTFRSRNSFCLYLYSASSTLYPLTTFVEEMAPAYTIEEDVLVRAVELHAEYESALYGSVLTEMPQEDPADDLLRVKSTFLMNMGHVPRFGEPDGERYYGNFSGYDIVFMIWPTDMNATLTGTIGGQTFYYHRYFSLYAIKDWQLEELAVVFKEGHISQEDIIQLAKIHEIANNPNKALEEINELFGNLASWYNRAIVSGYSDPTQIDLKLLFYVGFDGESRDPTDEEWEQLKDHRGFHEYMDLMRLPADKMNQVLMDLFGITLEDVDDAGFKNLVYLESTGCYYHMVTDFACVENFKAKDIEINANGTITVYYTANWGTEYRMTLVWHGEGYRILSNEIRPLEVLP